MSKKTRVLRKRTWACLHLLESTEISHSPGKGKLLPISSSSSAVVSPTLPRSQRNSLLEDEDGGSTRNSISKATHDQYRTAISYLKARIRGGTLSGATFRELPENFRKISGKLQKRLRNASRKLPERFRKTFGTLLERFRKAFRKRGATLGPPLLSAS